MIEAGSVCNASYTVYAYTGCITFPSYCNTTIVFSIPMVFTVPGVLGGFKPALLSIDMIVTNNGTPLNPAKFDVYRWSTPDNCKYHLPQSYH